jgi:hypothetical protein
VDDFGDWKSLDGKKVTLNNKITVLGLVVLVFWKIEVTLILIKKFTNGIILSKTFSFDDLSLGTESDINSIFDERSSQICTMAFFVCHAARD